jgi:catechol 2,3-dioxygenase-like lactoylglutathione lyase family enzyme
MAKVLGVGGLFFKSPDPRKLGEWYARWLGMKVEEWGGAVLRPGGMPPGGATVWSPFPEATEYFSPSRKEFMFNLVVDDLDAALAQVAEGGAEVKGPTEEFNGRFGWFVDPDGNKVELWQPAVAEDAGGNESGGA